MRKKLLLLTLIGVTLACQVIPTPPSLKSTPRPSPSAPRPARLPTEAPATPAATAARAAPGWLAPFPTHPAAGFAGIQAVEWSPAGPEAPHTAPAPQLPADSARIANPDVIAGLSLRQRAALLQNGSVVVRTREPQFAAIRARVSDRYGQPYYLTVDAAVHALDLAVDQLRLALEKEELHRRMIAVTRATLEHTLAYLPFVQGRDLEAEVLQAAVFLGTGLRLLDPAAELPAEIADRVERQAAQALAARGVEDAVLIPGYRDDFRAYRPPPPYAGDAALAAYYRGRAWFGRAAFALDGAAANRAPLVLTLALRQAQLPPAVGAAPTQASIQQTAVEEWARLADTLTYLDGPAAGYGPRQTAALMDQVYGPGVTIVGLSDPGKWEQFRRLAAALPPAELGGAPLNPLLAARTTQEWHWMAYGLRLDDAIGAFLGPYRPRRPDGAQNAPAALEWAAALGSPPALAELQAAGGEQDYADALGRAQTVLSGLAPTAWGVSRESQGLYALAALAAAKDDAYPAGMHVPSWQARELGSSLGAWVALRRQAQASTLQAGAAASRPLSASPPAGVEPNPNAFYRLAYLAAALVDGLEQRRLSGVFATTPQPGGLRSQAQALLNLADRLQRLGDLAARALRGEPLGRDDWALITAPLGAAEQGAPDGAGLPPTPALVMLADAGRYAASGLVDRVYVLAPVGEQFYIAQGGVYSFYEFSAAQYGPIDEPGWSRLIALGIPETPAWAAPYLLPEGAAVDVLAFQAGDVMRITPAAARLNLRAAPGRASAALRRLSPGDRVTLLDQTAEADGGVWRQVRLADGATGWLLQDPAYYERQ